MSLHKSIIDYIVGRPSSGQFVCLFKMYKFTERTGNSVGSAAMSLTSDGGGWKEGRTPNDDSGNHDDEHHHK